MEFYYDGVLRWDLGFDNPNKTGALLATLAVGVWLFQAWWRGFGFWLSLVLCLICMVGLIHTFSRGGLVAVLAGFLVLTAFSIKDWRWKPACVAGALALLVAGYALHLGMAQRSTEWVAGEDRSVLNRLEIWKMAPAMMTDAPGGWGYGNSGDAFTQWYQETGRLESYRSLVNSHLTWLVELGWPGRVLYLWGWLLVALLCWPGYGRKGRGTALAVWAVFGISAVFSSVGEEPFLWMIPGLFLLGVLAGRFREGDWPGRRPVIVTAGVAVAVAGLFLAVGKAMPGPSEIERVRGATLVGGLPPEYQIVGPDWKVMGRHYGHALRARRRGVVVYDSPRAFNERPWPGVPVVVVGENEFELSTPNDSPLILLNPGSPPVGLAEHLKAGGSVRVVWGEFRDDPTWVKWRGLRELEGLDIVEARGAGEYLFDWLDYLED